MGISTARLLDSPTQVEKRAVADALNDLGRPLKYALEIPAIKDNYFPIETGDEQFKNALGVLSDGIVFYTRDKFLRDLLNEHGLPVREAPLKNSNSQHSQYRWKIPFVSVETISQFRPLFLAMVVDSITYVQSQVGE